MSRVRNVIVASGLHAFASAGLAFPFYMAPGYKKDIVLEKQLEGIQKYYEALKIDPHYASAYYNLGVVYYEMMQYDTALTCYEKTAFERPMYAEAYCNMGVIFKNRGDLELAIACYERCLAVLPNFEIAKNNMAIALTDLGTKEVAHA